MSTLREKIITQVVDKIVRWNSLPKTEQVEIFGESQTVIRDPIAIHNTCAIWQQVNEWQLGHGNEESKAYLDGLGPKGEVRIINDIITQLKWEELKERGITRNG